MDLFQMTKLRQKPMSPDAQALHSLSPTHLCSLQRPHNSFCLLPASPPAETPLLWDPTHGRKVEGEKETRENIEDEVELFPGPCLLTPPHTPVEGLLWSINETQRGRGPQVSPLCHLSGWHRARGWVWRFKLLGVFCLSPFLGGYEMHKVYLRDLLMLVSGVNT